MMGSRGRVFEEESFTKIKILFFRTFSFKHNDIISDCLKTMIKTALEVNLICLDIQQ